MDELIEKLIYEFETACHLSFDCIEEEKFAHAIQAACKAQRNACAREFRRYSMVHEYTISNNWARAISMSKIERCDYE